MRLVILLAAVGMIATAAPVGSGAIATPVKSVVVLAHDAAHNPVQGG